MVFASAACGVSFALAHGDGCRIPIGIDIDTIFAGARERKREIRCVNLKRIAAFEPANADVHRALRQLNLHRAVIKIQEGNAGLAADANGSAAEVKFAARISVGPETVARRERTVGIRLDPIRLATGLEGDRSLDVIEARHSSGRIVVRQCGRRKRKKESGKKN